MVTHDLVLRGLDFDSAYSIAQSIRDLLGDREEIEITELNDVIQEQLVKIYGEEMSPSLRKPVPSISEIKVADGDQVRPFSRGLLARSIEAGGVSLDRAYRLVAELEADLRGGQITTISRVDIAPRVAELLERIESKETARRYRLMRRVRNLSRPLIIYIGGTTGTGKSTLALELAPLLRIQRIGSTDTIRQVMRMVFTPSILPALHSSSFEAASPNELSSGSVNDPEFAQQLINTFEEQSTRVCVGVRAVVERAVEENTSVLVEGVHIHPARMPFPELEGVAYQVPLFLVTMNEETHRGRFLARARHNNRRAERYLENFESIRYVHDHLLQQIELNEQPVLDTSTVEPMDGRALRIITGILERQVPSLSSVEVNNPSASPVLLVIIDGLADRPTDLLDDKTPMQAADTPTFDRLASEGRCGLADVIGPNGVGDTVAGTLALFGQSPLSLHRGPAEAIGGGLDLEPGDVALRGNFATVEAGTVIDRRAGRIREGVEELAEAIDELPLPGKLGRRIHVRVKPTSEHRLAIVLRGEGLSPSIRGSDPGDPVPAFLMAPQANDEADERAILTAQALELFEAEAHRVLSDHPLNAQRQEKGLPVANSVITRGAGRIHRLLPLENAGKPLRMTCIGRDRAVLGLARMVGATTITTDGMTANLDTSLEEKFSAAREALTCNDLVAVHVKGADVAAHDGDPVEKSRFLAEIDKALGGLLDTYPEDLRVVIAADHATVSESGRHANDPVPVVIWGDGQKPDAVTCYDEQSAASGGLGRFPLQQLLGKTLQLS